MKYAHDPTPLTSPRAATQDTTARALQVKETVSHETSRALGNIKSAAREQLERQRLELSSSLGSVSEALLKTSRRMNGSSLSPQLRRAADAMSSARSFLEHHQVDDVGVALRRLSLRNPVVFYSSLFAVGFVAGRFLTSTEQSSLEEPELEIDLLQVPPHVERQTPKEEVVTYRGPY